MALIAGGMMAVVLKREPESWVTVSVVAQVLDTHDPTPG